MSRKTELKRAQVRVYDVTKSCEQWKQLAQENQKQVKELQGEVQELQSQLDDSKKTTDHSPGAAGFTSVG